MIETFNFSDRNTRIIGKVVYGLFVRFQQTNLTGKMYMLKIVKYINKINY